MYSSLPVQNVRPIYQGEFLLGGAVAEHGEEASRRVLGGTEGEREREQEQERQTQRQRASQSKRERDRERERARERESVCVCERERERDQGEFLLGGAIAENGQEASRPVPQQIPDL